MPPLPPNTVLLSQMMRDLSEKPGFNEAIVSQLNKGEKKGPALLTPGLLDELRTRILGQYWVGLDRFPGWTMREINPTLRVVGHVAGKSDAAENLSAVHPGVPAPPTLTRDFLDLGPYSLDREEIVSLDTPSTLPGFSTEANVTALNAEVSRGDGPGPLASEHAESQRLADVLNRLSSNHLDGAAPFGVRVSSLQTSAPQPNSPPPSQAATRPEDLIAALVMTGHSVSVTDSRYFANFGHFHYKGQEVMMPFWVNSQIVIPSTRGRYLLVPVSHAEYEWHIRGPRINADVSFYFGIDGKSQWRTMDTLDQAWVLKRDAHTYTGPDAIEVTRLAGLLTVAYMHLHAANPRLPFGGYYALGVCQDGVSAIEKRMTGHVTLFPNTADMAFFTDPRDPEINTLIDAIPKDRDGADPEPERIFGSLPTVPGPDGDFSAITIPDLAGDLEAVYAAWQNGTLRRSRSRLHSVIDITLLVCVAIGVGAFAINTFSRRRNEENS